MLVSVADMSSARRHIRVNAGLYTKLNSGCTQQKCESRSHLNGSYTFVSYVKQPRADLPYRNVRKSFVSSFSPGTVHEAFLVRLILMGCVASIDSTEMCAIG